MAGTTTRFARPTDNKMVRRSASVTPRIINGDTVNFTTPPALVQDPKYPMSNLLLPDRYTPWSTPVGSAPDPVILHVDTGTITPALIGLFGIRWFGGGSIPNQCIISHRTSYLSTGFYSTTGVADVTIPMNSGRDASVVGVLPTGRYWEFYFPNFSPLGFSIGSIFMGVVSQDLGMLYSAGAVRNLIVPVVQGRTGGGNPNSVVVGDERELITMPFRNITDATKSKLDLVFGRGVQRDAAVWVDAGDIARQVQLANYNLPYTHRWGTPNSWDLDLDLEVLG